MKVISSPGRGLAFVGPGHFKPIGPDSGDAAVKLVGGAANFIQGTDAEFDKWKALCLPSSQPVLSGDDVQAIKLYVAQQVVTALTGPNGHLIPDGDVDRISDGVLDRMSVRLAQ